MHVSARVSYCTRQYKCAPGRMRQKLVRCQVVQLAAVETAVFHRNLSLLIKCVINSRCVIFPAPPAPISFNRESLESRLITQHFARYEREHPQLDATLWKKNNNICKQFGKYCIANTYSVHTEVVGCVGNIYAFIGWPTKHTHLCIHTESLLPDSQQLGSQGCFCLSKSLKAFRALFEYTCVRVCVRASSCVNMYTSFFFFSSGIAAASVSASVCLREHLQESLFMCVSRVCVCVCANTQSRARMFTEQGACLSLREKEGAWKTGR